MLGTVLVPLLQGAQLWVRYINEQGGLNGHQVKLVVYDDGGDPARHRAQVQEAVEKQNALGFLMNGETVTGNGSVDYITRKRVPVIGTVGGENWAFTSPMYFPQGSTGLATARIFVPATAAQVVPKGKTKLGTLICVEAEACNEFDRSMAEQAKSYGFDQVYRGRVSTAQPDFTAECLAARNQGVEVFFIAVDANALGRLSAACVRQGYRPILAAVGQGVADASKDNPNLEGLLSSSTVFPYFQSGTPATDEFRGALRTYFKGNLLGIGTAIGWAAGKLLERGASKLAEPPTREALLAGLWSIKNDNLGGLTMPLTFVENQPSKPMSCWFNLAISHGAWLSPDNYQLHCI